MSRLVLVFALLLLLAVPSAASASWRWPVRGEVVTPFALDRANRFAAGQHRGIDIAAPAGAAVRAPCGGAVRFAGRLPGRGRAVTIACGGLHATILELATTATSKGDDVRAGQTIGTVQASHIQLGARRADDRNGYVDPRALLTDAVPGPPPPAAPKPRGAPRAPRPRAVPRPRAAPQPKAAPLPRAAPAPRPRGGLAATERRLPVAAWVGLGLLGLALPLGAAAQTATRARAGVAARLPTPSVARGQTR